MKRQRASSKEKPAFDLFLKANGWLLQTAPMDFLSALGLDEYVYVEKRDRLVHLHIAPAGMEWEAKRYVRETFGDYTTAYKPLGKGTGFDSLKTFVEARKTPQESSS